MVYLFIIIRYTGHDLYGRSWVGALVSTCWNIRNLGTFLFSFILRAVGPYLSSSAFIL
jgi:hypothetical protein